MAYLLGMFKVKELAQWKTAFDSEEGKALRKAGGMKSYQLFQTEDDANSLVILCRFDSMDRARKFMQSDELREASEQSGVIEQGGTYFIEEIGQAG